MKKFYLHNGTEQQGPFDIDELKTKNINKDTPIWHEGLSEWTVADKIDELKDLLKTTTPPPFAEKQKIPPPITKPLQKEQATSNEPKKKKSYFGIIVTLIVLLVILGGGVTMIMNNPNAIPGFKLEINTPKPTVVTSKADGKNSGLFNARTTVYASVLNQGGEGNILVTFYVYQGSKTYDKTKSIYLSAGQSQDLEMTFEEVDYLSGDITYNVEAIAQ
jgi:hypothetical protein